MRSEALVAAAFQDHLLRSLSPASRSSFGSLPPIKPKNPRFISSLFRFSNYFLIPGFVRQFLDQLVDSSSYLKFMYVHVEQGIARNLDSRTLPGKRTKLKSTQNRKGSAINQPEEKDRVLSSEPSRTLGMTIIQS